MVDTNKLISPSKDNIALLKTHDKCDKYDYLTAVACGAIGGLVDIFLVGAPGDSVLGKWTDKQVDRVVMKFARHMGWDPKEKNKQNVKSAIGFLERNFKVNYDQRHSSDVNNLFNMAPNAHHMMSLAHSPDIIGLFFSILNQFTSTSSFIADGKLVTIDTQTFELKGGNFPAKIFCGTANWFGHLMSDVAGGSGAHGRGSGIVMPFYELFGCCKFGQFNTKNGTKDLAELAAQAFNEGYDFRHGLTMAIPVLITDLTIRLIWSLRQRFQFNQPIKECIPSSKHDNLRVMLLIGNGTLCVMDAIDAGIRSGGDALLFFTRLNLVAWFRLVKLVLKEVCIRLGLNTSLDDTIAAFKRINAALDAYLIELKQIDIALFKAETERYNQMLYNLEHISDEDALHTFLLSAFDELNIAKPWQGDFDDFMNDSTSVLEFK